MLFTSDLSRLTLVPEGFEGNAVLPADMATVPACVFSRCIKLTAITVANAKAGSTAASAFTSKDGILYSRNEDGETLTLIAAPAGLGASASIASSCTRIAEGAFTGNTSLRTIIASGAVEDIATGDGTASPVPAFDQQTIAEATVLADERSAWESAGFTRFSSPARPGDSTTLAPDESGFIYTLMEDGHLSVRWAGDAPATGERTIVESATLHGVNYTVTAIEDGALRGQTELTALVLPDTIASIGANAFEGCTALASMSIPGSVRTIGEAAFEGCASLTEIALNQGTATISERAFAGTAIDKLTLPASVEAIGDAAFDGCASLSRILLLGAPVSVSSSALGSATGVAIYAPAADAPVWPVLPASGNTLHEYAMQAPASPLELTVGEEADLLAQEGALLKASGDIEIDCSYKGASIYADATGIVKAKAPGTSPVTAALSLDGTELAKATAVVIVRAAPAPMGEGEADQEDAVTENPEAAAPQEEADTEGSEAAEFEELAGSRPSADAVDVRKGMSGTCLRAVSILDKINKDDPSIALAADDPFTEFDPSGDINVGWPSSNLPDVQSGKGSGEVWTIELNAGTGAMLMHYCEGYMANISGHYSINSAGSKVGHAHMASKKIINMYRYDTPTGGNRKSATVRVGKNDGSGNFLITNGYTQSGSECNTYKRRYLASKKGHTFLGWGDKDSDSWYSSGSFNYNEHPNKLYAKFDPNPYTIKFDGNGATYGDNYEYPTVYDQNIQLANGFYREGFEFAGWALTPTGPKVYDENATVKNLTDKANGVVTLYALWNPISCKIIFKDETGTTSLKELDLSYGDQYKTPKAADVGASKANTDQYVYYFMGWASHANHNPNSCDCGGTYSEDASLTAYSNIIMYASFYSTLQKYVIQFLNGDGKVLQSESYEYGTTPTCRRKPTKAATAQYTYTHSGWSPAITTVTGDQTYAPTFTETTRSYPIKFYDYDAKGNLRLLQETQVKYGSTPAYDTENGTPSKPSSAEWNYSWNTGWDPAIAEVTGAASYTATFDGTKRKYSIRFLGDDGAVLQKGDVEYGTTPSYSGNTPTKTWTNQYEYSFSKWDPKIASVTGAQDYKATFSPKQRFYTVTLTGKSANANKGGTSAIYEAYNLGWYPEASTDKSAISAITKPERAGWTFGGYPDVVDKDGKIIAANTAFNAAVSKDPIWTANKYSITYVLGKGQATISGQKTEYTPADESFSLVNPTCPGYDFAGWTVTGMAGSEGSGITASGTTTTVTQGTYGNLTATANWTPKVYTVSFDENVGDTGDNVTNMPDSFEIKFSDARDMSHGPWNQVVRISENIPQRIGYTFKYWSLTATTWNGTEGSWRWFPGGNYGHMFVGDVTLKAVWEQDTYRVNFYRFTGDAPADKLSLPGGYLSGELKYEETFPLPQADMVADADKVSGYYLYGWSYSKDAGANGAELSTFVLPRTSSIRDIFKAMGIDEKDKELKEINLYAVWQMVYSITCPTDSTAAIVLDASEKQVLRASEVALTSTTPAEIAVGAKSEYNASTFEKVFPDTRVRDVGFAFTEQGSSEEKYFPLTGNSPYGWVTWQGEDIIASELTRIPKGSGATGPAARREATLSLDFNPNSVNISHELQYEDGTMQYDEDGNEQTGSGLLMNGTRWKDPIARITWMFKPVEESALTYTLLPSMPAAGSAPGHGTGAIEADARPFE